MIQGKRRELIMFNKLRNLFTAKVTQKIIFCLCTMFITFSCKSESNMEIKYFEVDWNIQQDIDFYLSLNASKFLLRDMKYSKLSDNYKFFYKKLNYIKKFNNWIIYYEIHPNSSHYNFYFYRSNESDCFISGIQGNDIIDEKVDCFKLDKPKIKMEAIKNTNGRGVPVIGIVYFDGHQIYRSLLTNSRVKMFNVFSERFEERVNLFF